MQLFINLSSESSLEDNAQIPVLTGDRPAFSSEHPMALVQCPPVLTTPVTTQKTYRLKAKYNRRLYPSKCHFTKKMLIIILAAFYSSDPEWLGYSVGEILTYDGIKRSRKYYGPSSLTGMCIL